MILKLTNPDFLHGEWGAESIKNLRQFLNGVVNQINSQVQGVGPALASAPTITPSYAIHHVTGTATISNISAPVGFSGPIFLVPDGLWSTDTAGNIALATTAVVGQTLILLYDPNTLKWYPSYV